MTLQQQAANRQRCSLLVYGSLMHPQQRRACGLLQQPALPVVLAGYVRTFDQEPAWRTGIGDDRGVLRVHPDPAARLNAILLGNVPAAVLAALDHRERGYIRTPLAIDQLSPFEQGDLPDLGSGVFTYAGRPERFNRALRPHPKYHALCIAAAAVWGKPFRRMFLETTLAGGQPLSRPDPPLSGVPESSRC